MSEMPRFLVLRGGAIGDFVMTLPALAALRRRWPACRIEVLGYPHIAALAVAGGLADRIRSLDESSAALLFVPERPLAGPLAAYVRAFDVAISYLYDPDDSVRASLERAGVPQVLTGSPRMADLPAARQLMKPLEALAVFPEDEPVPRLNLSEETRARGRAALGEHADRTVILHPGSGSPAKNWPLARFVETAQRLRAAGLAPVFSFGEADGEAAAEFARMGADFPVLPPLDLPTLAGACATGRLYVGNDSGVTHVAAATGIPVVAVFGPSDAEIWASRGPWVRVVRAPARSTAALAALPADAVWAAIETALAD